MANLNFVCKCIEDTIDGLQDGLSHFSSSSRAALIYAITPDDPMRIYDPQNLLRGHEPIFEELYLVSGDWRRNIRFSGEIEKFRNMQPEKNLELTGLISWGGRSSSVFYQMWFSEHHPDMCSNGALHIGADTCLHGFACLLDGRTVAGEDRARGARYNSALRFSSEHDNIVVVVVSSDRPVSVIQEGVEISAQCLMET